MQTLAGPEERAAYIWVLGEHGQRVQSAPYLLEALVEGFADEPAKVRLALLAAVPRLFFRRAPECRGALGALLAAGAADADVEVRDRALFALRLLRHDVHAAREVLGAPLPLISRPGEEQAAEVEVGPAGFRGGGGRSRGDSALAKVGPCSLPPATRGLWAWGEHVTLGSATIVPAPHPLEPSSRRRTASSTR